MIFLFPSMITWLFQFKIRCSLWDFFSTFSSSVANLSKTIEVCSWRVSLFLAISLYFFIAIKLSLSHSSFTTLGFTRSLLLEVRSMESNLIRTTNLKKLTGYHLTPFESLSEEVLNIINIVSLKRFEHITPVKCVSDHFTKLIILQCISK